MESIFLFAQEAPAYARSTLETLLEVGGMGGIAVFCLWWMKKKTDRQVDSMEEMINRLMTKSDEHVEAFTDAVNNQTKAIENQTRIIENLQSACKSHRE